MPPVSPMPLAPPSLPGWARRLPVGASKPWSIFLWVAWLERGAARAATAPAPAGRLSVGGLPPVIPPPDPTVEVLGVARLPAELLTAGALASVAAAPSAAFCSSDSTCDEGGKAARVPGCAECGRVPDRDLMRSRLAGPELWHVAGELPARTAVALPPSADTASALDSTADMPTSDTAALGPWAPVPGAMGAVAASEAS